MRVVSLACSCTEIVCALGCAHVLVGVDSDSDYPREVVDGLPRLGRELLVDAEAVAALKPDLVLASLTVPGHEKVVARLAEQKLDMLVLAPTSVADVRTDIRRVAAILGVPERGERLAEKLLLPSAPGGGPRVLVEWWPKPVIGPGRRSWVHDLLEAAGATNPLGDRAVESTPLTADEVATLDPEAVVISWCGVPPRKYRPEVVLRRPGWAEVSAVRNGRVYCVPEAFLGRPGPRLVEGLEALRGIVRDLEGG